MYKFMTSRNLIIINFVIVSFFILIYLLNYFKIDFVLIGVFKELLTIPFVIAQVVFLAIGLRYLIKNQRSFLLMFSFLLLAICTFITIRSFF
ncbi:hypothetical protein SAMN05444395_10863 [Flavobacterium fryxellicola]|nr:hypothetical protein SAMN05444395_10863 [Flavobacterium fryxellicola]